MSTAVPKMGSEAGYAVDEQPAPIRGSGFISAVLGLASGACLLGRPLLFLPVLAILFGLIALRKSEFGVPVGTLAAKIGLFLAVLFGTAGFFYPFFSQRMIGTEAEQFSRDYLGLLARGNFEMAIELGKGHIQRLPQKMSLVDHYAPLREAADPSAQNPNVVALHDDREGVAEMLKLGPDVELFTTRTTRLYSRFGEPKVDTYWNNAVDPFEHDLILTLTYEIDNVDQKSRQWYLDNMRFDMEQPVAERTY